MSAMFSEPHPAFKGLPADAPWLAHFETCLARLHCPPPSPEEALAASLREWEQGGLTLTSDTAYQAKEQYCIRQTFLWEIYQHLESKAMGDTLSRTIYNRACDVLEHTFPAHRPIDLSFREGDNLIRKMLEHLRSVAAFYENALQTDREIDDVLQELPPSTGFRRTTVLESTANPDEAETMLQTFLAENQFVRTILLGDDASAGATIVDKCLTIPGAGITPGRGLWVKSHTLLRLPISTWLGAALPHEYEQVRCIFMSPKGKPASFLSKTEPLTFATVSLKIIQAAKLGLLLLLFLLAQTTSAQSTILHLRELPGAKRDTIEIPPGGRPIVDINSQLEIRPDLAAIQAVGQARYPQLFVSKLLQDKVVRINDALSNQQRIVELTKQWTEGLNVQRDLLDQVETFLQKIVADPALSTDFNRYTEEYFDRFIDDPNPPDRFIYSLQRFNAQLNEISGELQKVKQNSQIQFSVVAFRRDASGGSRIHIENFDEFANGEYFPVNRWVTTLSRNDRDQLENCRQLAQGLNESSRRTLNAYKEKLLESFPSIDCVQRIRPELETAIQSLSGDLKASMQKFKDGQTEQIVPLFTSLRQELRNWPPTESPDWKNRLNTMFIKLDTISRRFTAAVGDSTVLKANPHLLEVNSCLKRTLRDLQRIQFLVEKFPYDYLRKVSLSCEDLAEEIKAFDLGSIPPVGTIDLEYTGQRKPGDEILIKAVFRLPEDSTDQRSTGHTIEVHRLKMMLVGAHSITKVGLIMANPYTLDAPPGTPQFRFAPSAALLLKFGSRKSHFYNNFLDLGIGLNTAAPDFDLDGSPEFSAGITGTIFRDILSFGWDWNFGLDRPNYFIGIHLPFNLPGVPVNTIQSNPLPEN